jgi:circadian clock protein KaiC
MLQSVRRQGTKVIVIDSLTGYTNAVGNKHHVLRLFHDLLVCLSEMGILTIMIMTNRNDSSLVSTKIDASYISDTVVVLRHFEFGGRIRRCIAVVKKRHGPHEHTIREFKIARGGCEVGPPLTDFHGVLSGTPVYHGDPEKLLPYGNED